MLANAAYRSLTDSEGVDSRELCDSEGVGSRVKGERVALREMCATSRQLCALYSACSSGGGGGDGSGGGGDAGARLRVARSWCAASTKAARHAEKEFSVPGDRLLAPGVRRRGLSRGVRCELESGIVFWCYV